MAARPELLARQCARSHYPAHSIAELVSTRRGCCAFAAVQSRFTGPELGVND